MDIYLKRIIVKDANFSSIRNTSTGYKKIKCSDLVNSETCYDVLNLLNFDSNKDEIVYLKTDKPYERAEMYYCGEREDMRSAEWITEELNAKNGKKIPSERLSRQPRRYSTVPHVFLALADKVI